MLPENYQPSQKMICHYEIGQYVDVSGRSIGKGFAGVMKNNNKSITIKTAKDGSLSWQLN